VLASGARAFFLGVDQDPEEVIESLVDLCFDIAHVLRQHPDCFLNLTVPDLNFYAAATVRLTKRLKGGD
jgi:hypothetical protein